MLSEFDLIKQYFQRARPGRAVLGIGDDCALMAPKAGMQLAVSTDMLVEGRHFFKDADPFMLGHKCLAVNLSDLAAMGAEPTAFTLALALPEADRAWLSGFSSGLFGLADLHDCELIGGDTTRGPLTICITVFGQLQPGQALRRDAARPGDDIWISGTLGDARLALAAYLDEVALNADSLQQAAARMRIDVDALPAGPVLARQHRELRRRFTVAGGDDYELCFTAPPHQRAAIAAAGLACGTPVTRVGQIETAAGLRYVDGDGQPLQLDLKGFDHFT